MLRDLLSDPDPDTAAYVAYLLALLGDRTGFDALVTAARSHGLDGDWGALLYRAITKLNDDAKTPLLEEIYHAMNHQDTNTISEFYWTVRAMTGPNILKLRKKIRDEIGVQNLN
jgi:HEAT repeat protein